MVVGQGVSQFITPVKVIVVTPGPQPPGTRSLQRRGSGPPRCWWALYRPRRGEQRRTRRRHQQLRRAGREVAPARTSPGSAGWQARLHRIVCGPPGRRLRAAEPAQQPLPGSCSLLSPSRPPAREPLGSTPAVPATHLPPASPNGTGPGGANGTTRSSRTKLGNPGPSADPGWFTARRTSCWSTSSRAVTGANCLTWHYTCPLSLDEGLRLSWTLSPPGQLRQSGED